MIVNGMTLFKTGVIEPMKDTKEKLYGVSHGMSEAGYDIRIAEDLFFYPEQKNLLRHNKPAFIERWRKNAGWRDDYIAGRFCLGSTIERFKMPGDLVGIVHDKSTWARRGVSVFNTVIEPGWEGFLTLEIVFHGDKPVKISSGQGIAQVVFHRTTDQVAYDGKYQNQQAGPTEAIYET